MIIFIAVYEYSFQVFLEEDFPKGSSLHKSSMSIMQKMFMDMEKGRKKAAK